MKAPGCVRSITTRIEGICIQDWWGCEGGAGRARIDDDDQIMNCRRSFRTARANHRTISVRS